MPCIKRIFVEKKKEYAIEAKGLLNDIKENLQISELKEVRILNRYDIEDISQEQYDLCKNTIFSEPPVDIIFENEIDFNSEDFVFAIEYLPGQYDQRADSSMQCIQAVIGCETLLVATAKVFIFIGKLNDDNREKIIKYCINPVDSRQASLDIPKTLKLETKFPQNVKEIEGFIKKSSVELLRLKDKLELAMSEEDLIFCQKYFAETEKRNPTITEIKLIDTYWSDHCRHTTFLTNIEKITFEDGYYKELLEKSFVTYMEQRKKLYSSKIKKVCLMDIAIIGAKVLKEKGILKNLDESEEINACSVVIPVDVDGVYEDWLIMFKNETHNHPTEIEPFGGAGTCLGGAIRDPLSGRSYVYQAMRVTGSGDPRKSVKDTLFGKLPQRKITTLAAHGYSSYGNQIGIATGIVSEVYDEGYVAKRMEIGAVVGAVKRENVVRETPLCGDIVVLIGGRTGRDGCGGATGSSKEHNENSISSCGAEVQKGNPIIERKLQRLFRNPEVTKLIKRCNDFGAGGVSVAIGELAEGLDINLDLILKKYNGLDGTELAISESQERMAVVINQRDLGKFTKLANDENLEATAVAIVTDNKRLKMTWRGNIVVDISRDFLDTNGVTQKVDVKVISPTKKTSVKNEFDLKYKWLENLSKLNVASQKGLVERFDSTIGSNTVLMPFGGKNQLTPIEAMVSKVPVLNGKTTAVTLMSYGFNPEVANWSSYHSAVYAVVDSISKIVATGGDYKKVYLTFQEYFEKLGKNPEKWGKPFIALLGALEVQLNLGIGAIGGKDSMSGTFNDLEVPPTLVSFALGTANVNDIISPEFKEEGSFIVRLNTNYNEFDMPDFNNLKENFERINKLIVINKILSAMTIGVGGVSATVSKMAFGNSIGAKIKCEDLFNYEYGSFILEVDREVDLDSIFEGLNYEVLGKTILAEKIIANGIEIDLEDAKKSWFKTFESIFPTLKYQNINTKSADLELYDYNIANRCYSGEKFAKPKVFIPVFPGTNCEYDMARAFKDVGANVETLVIKNLDVSWLEESIDKMVKSINSSQIIAFSGGFSAGDEPDGSGKFISAIFRNQKIKEAVMNLLNNRDGLAIGICNGFQALIKLGLVPYGQIIDMKDDSPTLTFNTIGRHISCLSNTKVVSNKSPWFWESNLGDIHKVAFSHGEGRFVADEKTILSLAKNGQIATQYVDKKGNPTYDIKNNPNGSMYAIEGITSPDGRVLGKMGHSERFTNYTYKNILGEADQKIFKSGVKYFL